MAEDRMPEKGVTEGNRPHYMTTILQGGDTVRERPANPDRTAPPWERLQDWTTVGFDKEYCGQLDKANNVHGIGTEFHISFVRDPNYYEKDNRPREIRANYPGSFVIKAPDGKGEVKLGEDLLAIAIPKKYIKFQDDHDRSLLDKIEEGGFVDPGSGEFHRRSDERGMIPNWERMSIDERRAAKDAQSRYHRETGMIGGSSPTAGMPLIKAEMMMINRGIDPKDEEKEYRTRGRAAPKTRAEMLDVMLSGREKNDPLRKKMVQWFEKNDPEKRASTGKAYSAQGAGFAPPVNPRSPLGQAQARKKGK